MIEDWFTADWLTLAAVMGYGYAVMLRLTEIRDECPSGDSVSRTNRLAAVPS